MEQKVKQDIHIGQNIRKVRKNRGLGQTDLVRLLQIEGCDITRECLVKIERGVQHVRASQLQTIKRVLQTTYDVLIDGEEENQ